MGKTLLGGTENSQIDLLTPQQKQFFSSTVSGDNAQLAGQGLNEFMQPKSIEDYQKLFQQSFIQPALQSYRQDILPTIGQNFSNVGASSSSALNQTLARSAADLSTGIGSQIGNFYQQQQQQRMNAINQTGNFAGQHQFIPQQTQFPGILGPALQTAGTVGAVAAFSSKEVKKDIEKYNIGIEHIRNLNVKKYTYDTTKVNVPNNTTGYKIGLIAEDVPKEIQTNIDIGEGKILGVDVYALVSLLVNSVKTIDKRIQDLEKNCEVKS